ncbi:histidine phosphatase family protein [Lentzea sp. NBC_00516]|uniref:histidine phosphatase family protein n=1 Tax=Lentzea sp. NBC_00516 TaxID=2903582 RepID=UPI002E80DD05|nr:histidine phosphatase family protein [Lentzea sp. NBC_00516]WUD26511.1 histidine phosphatase family protein [Lentzea sp. NBC_00516]
MATRHLYVVRHGAADPFGELTSTGEQQVHLLGKRLAHLPIDAVWHSPLSRAASTAQILGEHLPNAPVGEAPELVDHIPHVPATPPPAWAGFFDGFDATEAAAGAHLAESLTTRFAHPTETESHEVLVTHAYQVAWLVRHALDAPADRWLAMSCGNTALTALQFRDGTPPTLLLYNDMSHLPAELRWTGFGPGTRP